MKSHIQSLDIIMIKMFLFLFAIATGLMILTAYSMKSHANLSAIHSPVVMELFTSQSCSSCPPADRVLSQFAQNDNVIALSCNVPYWNHLHWEDTLSQDFCTQRQKAYSQRHGRSGRVFTPEVILNGQSSHIGSHGQDIMQAAANMQGAVHQVNIVQSSRQTLRVTLPQSRLKNKEAVVLLVAYQSEHIQSISRGENRGRTVRYTNPVRSVRPIMDHWDGSARVIDVPVHDNDPQTIDGYAVLVQEEDAAGPVRAAGKIDITL